MAGKGQQLFAALPAQSSHTGRTLGIVGNVGDGEGLEDWIRSALELQPRARSTAEGSLKELEVIDCLSNTSSFEQFFFLKRLRLKEVTGTDT